MYQPFYRDKQEYQAPDANNWYPIFALEDAGLRIRFNSRVIRRGYQKTGRVLDNAGAQAVEILNTFLPTQHIAMISGWSAARFRS